MKKKLKISKKFNKSQDWEILEDDIPMMPDGGRTPIKGTKEQYQAYQDSLDLYNNYQDVTKSLKSQGYSIIEGDNLTGARKASGNSIYSFLDRNKLQKRDDSIKENGSLYSTSDFIRGKINPTLPRQLYSHDIKPKSTLRYEYEPTKSEILKNAFFPSDSYANKVGDERIVANYSNVKPVQPIIYQPEEKKIQYSKNVGNDNPPNTYSKKYPPIYVTDPNDPSIGMYTEAGNQIVYKAKERPKLQTIQLNRKEGLLESNPINLGDINPIPFEQGTFFSRERQNQELDSKQFGRKGKKDYFDKKTGKLLGTYGDGGKISLDEFRPKFSNSNQNIQQEILKQQTIDNRGSKSNPIPKSEIEIVAKKQLDPSKKAFGTVYPDTTPSSAEVASQIFSFIPEAFHTPSRLVNQVISKGEAPYNSEISETLGFENNDPTDMWTGIRNFAVDNAPDFLAPNVLQGFGKGIGKSVNYIDDISNINKELKLIRDKGVSSGLSEKQIKTLQMEQIGITDSQRKAFTPVISDVLSKYVKPISYEEGVISKLKDIPSNIKAGGWKNKMGDFSHNGKREDAWNLYLGKPQTNNTFRYSQTTPQSMVYPELKNGMDIYHLNYENDLAEYVSYMDKTRNYNKLFQGETIYPSDAGVMGGYNLTRIDANVGNSGIGKVEYNDIWDLHPKTTLRSIFPEKIAKNEWLNDKVFYKTSPEGISSPRQLELKMENFIGKPFMSHGKVPVNFAEPNSSFLNTISDKDKKLHDFLKFAKGYKFQNGGKVKLKSKSSDWEIIQD